MVSHLEYEFGLLWIDIKFLCDCCYIVGERVPEDVVDRGRRRTDFLHRPVGGRHENRREGEQQERRDDKQ